MTMAGPSQVPRAWSEQLGALEVLGGCLMWTTWRTFKWVWQKERGAPFRLFLNHLYYLGPSDAFPGVEKGKPQGLAIWFIGIISPGTLLCW